MSARLSAPTLAALFLLGTARVVLAEPGSFPVSEPAHPLVLRLSEPGRPAFGRAGPMRLVCYSPNGAGCDALDRETILRQIRLIRDFYGHFGLEIAVEDRVYEVRGGTGSARYPDGLYSYHYIQDLLRREGLYAPERTIVFAGFDVGLGEGMALTTINDDETRRRECPISHSGKKPWWCGLPEDAHWGGIVHEVGHMLGLPHPAGDRDAGSVMGRHWRFFRDPRVGLLPEEIGVLERRYASVSKPPR